MKHKIFYVITAAVCTAILSIPYTTANAGETAEADPELVQDSELYFSADNDPVTIQEGNVTELEVHGYEDGIKYLFGESPYKFMTDNESAAAVAAVHGDSVFIQAISTGTAVLTAKAPDGRTACIDIIVNPISTQVTVNTGNIITGDLNGDKKVNVADLVKMQLIIKKKSVYTNSADMNKDGTINVFDMIILKRLILNQ